MVQLQLTLAVMLVWSTPTTRTDGDILQPDEIGHYEVSRNGEPYTVTTENHTEAIRNGVYSVRACDVHNRCSDDSNELRVKIKGKRR